MNTSAAPLVNYRFMSGLAVVVGILGIAFQFLSSWEFFSFFLCVPVLGGLIGGSSGYGEQDRQQLRRSYKAAYEWLLLVVMAAYAFIVLSRWVLLGLSGVEFLNSHWPGLMLSAMCALLGLAGLYQVNHQ